MAPVVDGIHLVSPAVADLLVASVWQSILLTGAIALWVRYFQGISASTRFGLWMVVLALIVVLPVTSLLVPHMHGTGGRTMHLANDWSLGLACFWVVLSLLRALQLCLSAARLRSLARNAEPVEVDGTIAPLLELGSRPAILCTSGMVDRPTVIGFFRPRILLSPDLLERLSGPELHQIVLHEMEHLRRGDQWTNLLQQVSLVLLPWNPAVLWVNRRLCFERELACDDRVMRVTRTPKIYAACLVRLAEASMLQRGVSLAIGALGALESRARESELVKRVRRILSTAEPGKETSSRRFVVAGMLACAVAFSVLLAGSPRLVDFAAAPMTIGSATRPGADVPAVAGVYAEGARPTLVNAVAPTQAGAARAVSVVLRTHTGIRHRMHHKPIVGTLVTLTSAEDSQRLYAAVPWQGGWLLIQL